jgi:hypothetical protein
MGGDDMIKRIAFAVLLAFAAFGAATAAWADSSDSSISTTEAP